MSNQYSKKYFARAQKVMVEGVNSPVRCFKGVGGQPLIMRYAKGSQLTDADNNAYTDYCLSWGASILGHANRNMVLETKKNIERGASFGTTTSNEVNMAEYIVNHVPSIEKVRFVNSGTEATMSAIRLARGYTKRDLIIKFDGCYHGHFDDLLTTAGSGVAQLADSSSLGVPKTHIQNTISLPYNDEALLEKTIFEHKDQIACVIIEPVAGNMGVIPATENFLLKLRALTVNYGIVLIFDEIMSGFRASLDCVQGKSKVIPDMTCLGKIIGGGFPIGCYGGKEEIMNTLAPAGGVYQAGTFSGNPVVMRAGLAVLKQLNDRVYAKLNKKCLHFSETMNTFFEDNGIDAHLCAYHSMMSIRFRKEAVQNYTDAQAAAGGEKYGKLFHFLLDKGIYLPPADLEAFFVSTKHTKAELDYLAEQLQTFFINNR